MKDCLLGLVWAGQGLHHLEIKSSSSEAKDTDDVDKQECEMGIILMLRQSLPASVHLPLSVSDLCGTWHFGNYVIFFHVVDARTQHIHHGLKLCICYQQVLSILFFSFVKERKEGHWLLVR